MKIDDDLKKKTEKELRVEIMRLRNAFRQEFEHTGNHRCWINLMKHIPEYATINPLSLPKEVFLGNCARYFARNQSTSP